MTQLSRAMITITQKVKNLVLKPIIKLGTLIKYTPLLLTHITKIRGKKQINKHKQLYRH